jgi:1-phosphatidylinositol phosphodiesterase
VQPNPAPQFPVLSITFLSASSPLALPPLVARGFGWPSWKIGVEGVNSRVGKWVLGHLSRVEDIAGVKTGKDSYPDTDDPKAEMRLRGWCMMDYFTEPVDVGLVSLLVECNYRSRKAGEEGWPSTCPLP